MLISRRRQGRRDPLRAAVVLWGGWWLVFAPSVTAQAERLHALCASWPHDPGVSGTVRSSVPVVFLNGTADTTDPPANVADAEGTKDPRTGNQRP